MTVPLQGYSVEVAIVGLVLVTLALAVLFEGLELVQPHEKRVVTRGSEFHRVLDSGFNVVAPFVSKTHAVDMRAQQFDVTIEATTADDATVTVDATFGVRVSDAAAAFRELDDHRRAAKTLARTALRDVLEVTDGDDARADPQSLENRVRETVAEELDGVGLALETAEVTGVTDA